MTGKTHLAAGVASALALGFAVLPPRNFGDCLIAITGGAIGGVLPDVDAVKSERRHDALLAQALAFILAAAILVSDNRLNFGILHQIIQSRRAPTLTAAIAIAVLYIIGFISPHRTFTHSILALGLFAGCFSAILPRLGFFVMAGYLSHLLLDMLNKKGVPLLFPVKKGMCLKLFYADKTADRAFMLINTVAALALAGYAVVEYLN